LGSAVAFSMGAMAVAQVRTVALIQASAPVFAWLGLGAMAALSGSLRARVLGRVASVAYFCWWAWWLVRGDWLETGFAANNEAMLAAVLSLAAVALVRSRLVDLDRQPWRDPALIAALSVLLSNLPG